MGGEPTWTEKGEASAQAATNFVEHFREHRIWLDQDLCADIQTVNDRLYEATWTTRPTTTTIRTCRRSGWKPGCGPGST
jgi:hypothetical protein